MRKPLTGRGRASPYGLTVRAEDNGNPTLFTDVQVNILIGDVVSNDGIPMFIHPTEDEIAVISEVRKFPTSHYSNCILSETSKFEFIGCSSGFSSISCYGY